MTVIAWDGETLATDRQATCAAMRREVQKLFRLKTGELVAICGIEAGGRELIDWYAGGADPQKYPPLQSTSDWVRLIVVSRKGIFEYEQRPIALRTLTRFAAWGSGRDFAMGALAAGAKSQAAVRIASRFNVECGMGVDFMRLR